jgi:hypothetical protein
LKEREKKEFDQALGSIGGLRKRGEEIHKKAKNAETAFAVERLKRLEDFISTMDQFVGMMLSLEDLKRNFLGVGKKK